MHKWDTSSNIGIFFAKWIKSFAIIIRQIAIHRKCLFDYCPPSRSNGIKPSVSQTRSRCPLCRSYNHHSSNFRSICSLSLFLCSSISSPKASRYQSSPKEHTSAEGQKAGFKIFHQKITQLWAGRDRVLRERVVRTPFPPEGVGTPLPCPKKKSGAQRWKFTFFLVSYLSS